jgi:hypothetical protein
LLKGFSLDKEEFLKKLRYRNFYCPEVLRTACSKARELFKIVKKEGFTDEAQFFENISHIPLFAEGGLYEILDQLI